VAIEPVDEPAALAFAEMSVRKQQYLHPDHIVTAGFGIRAVERRWRQAAELLCSGITCG
jgi:hypothetical protein